MTLPKTLQKLQRDERVLTIDDERFMDQGYWVYLNDNYYSPGTECSTIHEMTVQRVMVEMGQVIHWPKQDRPEHLR